MGSEILQESTGPANHAYKREIISASIDWRPFALCGDMIDRTLAIRHNAACEIAADTVIAPEKVTKYLLVRQARGDKSAFLAKAGYTIANPEQLLDDLRRQVLSQEAVPFRRTKFGQFYEIRTLLIGPNRSTLRIRSIWMREHLSGVTKFITLVPDKTQ
jgi:hypothetical protein